MPKPFAKVGAAITDVAQGGDAFIKPFMVNMADDHYALDITRAKRLLGWQPQHSVMTSLSKMTETLKSNPEMWYQKNGLDDSDGK